MSFVKSKVLCDKMLDEFKNEILLERISTFESKDHIELDLMSLDSG
jgi:hypothetical protein